MNDREAEIQFRKLIAVTPDQFATAKSIILGLMQDRKPVFVPNLVDKFMSAIDLDVGGTISIDELDPMASLRRPAITFSWRLAAREAIASLLNATLLLGKGPPHEPPMSLTWTIQRGNSKSSGSWSFDDFSHQLPSAVIHAHWPDSRDGYLLADAGLYIGALGIKEMHAEVQSALKFAVECFRLELYTPSLAMLCKAAEGAWNELGQSLLATISGEKQSSVKNHMVTLESSQIGLMKKVAAVQHIFNAADMGPTITSDTHLNGEHLRNAEQWTNTVRDSRNTIHFGVLPSVPVTRETVSIALLAAFPRLRELYSMKASADRHRAA